MALATRSRNVLAALLGSLLLGAGLTACQSDEEKVAGFMSRAGEYMEADQYKEAIIEYRNVLQIDPNHVAAHRALAEGYLRNKSFKEGYWELSETIRLDPSDIESRVAYATMSLAGKRFEDALAQADAIIEIDPENATGYLLRAQAQMALEQSEEAEASLLEAVELEPEDDAYRMGLALYYGATDQPDKAEKQIREMLARDPKPGSWTALGRLLANDGSRDAEAEAAFEAAVERASQPTEDGEQSPQLAGTYRNLAGFYVSRGRLDDAAATIEEGVEKVEAERDKLEFMYSLARSYRSQGDATRADALLERASEMAVDDPGPYLTMSLARARDGDFQGALEAAESALALDPGSLAARLRRAELLVDIGYREKSDDKIAEGRQIAEQVLAENPTIPEALFVRAKIDLATGDPEAAVDTLRAAIDARPDWAQAHFVLGSALALTGEKQRARSELARAVELEPGLVEARSFLTRLHAELGEHEYAIEQGRTYLNQRPDDDGMRIVVAQSLVRLGKVDDAAEMLNRIPEERRGLEAFFAIGRIQLVRRELDAARENLLKANAARPHNAKVLSSLLSLDRAEGKLSQSIERIDDAVAAEPENGALRRLKGTVALLTNDLAQAEVSFKKAIELEPDNLQAYTQLGGLYRLTGRMQETVGIYEEAVRAQPESAPPHHFLAVLYEMSGKLDQAREQYELALRYDSSLGESKNNLAYLLAESGEDLDRALKLAQEAKAAMPDSPNAADTLGWVLLKRGVASAAIGYLREAVQVSDPGDPAIGVIRSHLSDAYAATGDLAQAIETLETALAEHAGQVKAGQTPAQDPPWAVEARAKIERLRGELDQSTS